MSEKAIEAELAKRRRKNFEAFVEKTRDGTYRDGTYLYITHNGHQYQAIDLNEEEMAKVIEVLQAELKSSV